MVFSVRICYVRRSGGRCIIRQMARNAATDEPLYRQVAHSIEQQIGRGVLRVGDKVPSVRSFSRHHRVSISTALQAYFWLEHRGYIEPRPRSGFYVRVPYIRRMESGWTRSKARSANTVSRLAS